VHPSLYIIRVTKARKMRWAGHLACMGERRVLCSCVEERHEQKRPLENQGVDGKIILKWIYKEWDGGADWIDVAQNRDRWRAL